MSNGVGIYIGRKYVVSAVAAKHGMRPFLQSFSIDAIIDSPVLQTSLEADSIKKISSETASVLNGLKQMKQAGQVFARVGISSFHVVTRYFIMPILPGREKDEAIRYEASRYTRFKITESVIGYSESSRVQNVSAITASAAKKRILKSLTMSLRRASVDPSAIEPDYVPFSRVCSVLGLSDFKTPQALIWFDGDSSVNLTLSSKGVVFLSQDFKLSGDREQETGKVYDELLGCFRFLSENAGGVDVADMFVAGFGDLGFWVDFLAKTFNRIQVHLVELPVPVSQAHFSSSALVLAYGLALGELGVKSPLGEIDLLPPEEKKMRREVFLGALAVAAGVVALFFGLILVLVFLPFENALKHERIRAEAPLAIYGSISTQSLADLESQMSVSQGRLSQLNRLENARIPLKAALTVLANSLAPGIWFSRLSYSGSSADSSIQDSSASDSSTVSSKKKGRSLKIEGYAYLGDANQESKQVNDWVQGLVNNTEFKKSFNYIAVDEVKQQKFAGRSTTKFAVTAEQ